MLIDTRDPLAVAVVDAIHLGDVASLRRLLHDHPELGPARIGDLAQSRTLLHVVTDWPGHFPNGAEIVVVLTRAGADVNAPFHGQHAETALHWAASSDDVEVLDALLDAGADLEARGGVVAGGTPLADATAFAQWETARRLVERGAQVTPFDAAALGYLDVVKEFFPHYVEHDGEELGNAMWAACHGGQKAVAVYLLARGADVNWVPAWEQLTPLDAAARGQASHQNKDVLRWLHSRGARTAAQLSDR
ncbi:MAG: ankyrin repeat family protein [Frankiales bacterium]|nr:ankyrin repeat family protein [Frankiales bacterium]